MAFVLPLLAVLPRSVSYPAIDLSAFARALGEPAYRGVLVTTLRMSVTVTAVTLVIAFPLAWLMSQAGRRLRFAIALLVLVPFLTSVLVRTFSWVAILGENGPVSQFLTAIGIFDRPTSLLFSGFAVLLALVHVSIPLMVFPLAAVMSRIDIRTVLVAQSLGRPRIEALFRTVVPLSLPGIQVGLIFVFLYNMAGFIAPAVLGSRRETMLAQIIQSQIESGTDWGFASALAVELVIVSLAVVAIIALATRRLMSWRQPRQVPPTSEREGAPLRDTHFAAVPMPTRRGVLERASSPRTLRVATGAFLVGIGIFILAPLVVIVPVSFTSASVLMFPPPGLSTQWYEAIATNGRWVNPAITSLVIALTVAVFASGLALCATLAFGRHSSRGHGLVAGFITAPQAVPTVVFALGAFFVFARVGLIDSQLGIIVAHTVLALPIAYLVVSSAYAAVDPRLEQVSLSLGAGSWMTLRKVLFPLMLPGFAVSMLLSALISFDEAVVSIFLSGIYVTTLPRRMWEGIRFNTSPEIAAVSTLLLLLTGLVILGAVLLFNRRGSSAGDLMETLSNSRQSHK